MRVETVTAWLFVGFGLLMVGMLLAVLQVADHDKLAAFVAVTGFVYLTIGLALTVIHGRHMAKRARASRE